MTDPLIQNPSTENFDTGTAAEGVWRKEKEVQFPPCLLSAPTNLRVEFLIFLVGSGVLLWTQGPWISQMLESEEAPMVSRLSELLLWLYAFGFVTLGEELYQIPGLLLEIAFPPLVSKAKETWNFFKRRLLWTPPRHLMRILFVARCVKRASILWGEMAEAPTSFPSKKAHLATRICGDTNLPLDTCRLILPHLIFNMVTLIVWVGGTILIPSINSLLLLLLRWRKRGSQSEQKRKESGGDKKVGGEECRGIGIPWAMMAVSLLQVFVFYVGGQPMMEFLLWDGQKPEEEWRVVTVCLTHVSAEHLWSNLCVQLLFSALLQSVFSWRSLLRIYFAGVFGGSISTYILIPRNRAIGASAGVYALIASFWATLAVAALQRTRRWIPGPSHKQRSFLRLHSWTRLVLFALTPIAINTSFNCLEKTLSAVPALTLWRRIASTFAGLVTWIAPNLRTREFTWLERESGHLGGVIGGAWLTWLFLLKKQPPQSEEQRLTIGAKMTVGVLVGVAYVLNSLR